MNARTPGCLDTWMLFRQFDLNLIWANFAALPIIPVISR
jgi:hypothetical protein